MPPRKSGGAPFAFRAFPYTIECHGPGTPDHATIGAPAGGAPPLCVGDLYTVAGPGCFCELTVDTVTRGDRGAWTARCTVSRRHWL